ncbi:MAG: arylsulfatase [Planctomycetota bacterium]|jgi:arylsulfatase|nr:arylsulfatase [Planctomycetota bacterium]
MRKEQRRKNLRTALAKSTLPICATLLAGAADPAAVSAGEAKPETPPNIVVIFGDDIGITNVSAYSRGLMGYQTPNIDRIANEGMMFTDYYAEQSSTAGRSAFITGQNVYRTGLSKVGVPGANIGLQAEDATIAEVLKEMGYDTAQFGKNHLGDKDEFLPTSHGFDEFYGNLYHLNAEEDPEHPDYPKDPMFRKRYNPRGVIESYADGRIIDSGPLTIKRMETIDDEIAGRAADYLERKKDSGKPLFMWVNFTHMHLRTHPKPESVGQSGPHMSEYTDVMIDHDKNVGTVLDKLDELGMADNTIVIYTTDNGPHMNTWPDGAMTPFRGEKNTNWEGAFRVPAMVRWPGKIKADSISNEIFASLDWFPTLVAAAGDDAIVDKMLTGYTAGKKTFKLHLDGFNQLPYLTGKEDASRRRGFYYYSDDGDLVAVRVVNYKIVFMEQRREGTFAVWSEPFTVLRVPKLFNLRLDPFERADITSNTYYDWILSHDFVMSAGAAATQQLLKTFVAFPPRQRAATFTIDQALEKLRAQITK